MRVRLVPSVALLGLVACSPAAPPPEAPKPPPPKAVVPPPVKSEPTHATWSFPSPDGIANAQLDLGDKGILQVGQRGRRWLFGKDGGAPKQAPTLAPQDLVDARLEGGKIVMLGDEGEVFTASDPLGPIDSVKPAPKDVKAFVFRGGKQAFLGLEKDGTLHRSTDGGATWVPTKVPMRPGDVAVGLAANRKGEALVLVHPQRVLLSTDDGASFKPIGTPGIGATAVVRDANDDLFLRGASMDKYAKLVSGKLDAGSAPVAFLERKNKDAPQKNVVTRRYLAGNRLVTLLETPEPVPSKYKKLEVAVSTLGGEPSAPQILEPAISKWGSRVAVSGFESTVVVAVYDDQADPPATKFVRTTDDGKSWEQLGTLAGRVGWTFVMHAGPGWILVGEVCDEETKSCKPAQAKIGTGEWKDLPLQPKSVLNAVEFDPTRDRVWVLASSGDAPLLLTAKLKEGNFTVSGVELPKGMPRASTVDAQGWLRLVYPYPSRIVRVAPDLGVHPSLYLPFQAYDIDLAGDRGFAYDGNDAWETADGGANWAKVAPGTSGDVKCTTAGCVQSGVVRLGWELPNGDKMLVASATQPPAKKEASPPTAKAPPPPPLKVTCKPTGAWKSYDASFNTYRPDIALDGDVRFAFPSHGKDQASGLLVAKGSGAPTKVALLGPDPKRKPGDPIRDRHWSQTTSEGFVAVRYSFSTEPPKDAAATSKYQPVDVDLAWYSAASGKTNKAKIAKVSPFRVGQSSSSALHAIVEGGLLFLPHDGDAPLYYVRENGKTETMPRPPSLDGFGYSDAVKIGNKIALARLRYSDVALAVTSDAGKTWSTTTWTLGTGATLGVIDGKFALMSGQSMWSNLTAPKSLFVFDTVGNDPPDPVPVDVSKLTVGASGFEACTPKSRGGFRVELGFSRERRSVSVSLEKDGKSKDDESLPTTFAMQQQVDRIDGSGTACVDAVYTETTYGAYVYAVVPPHDMTHAWLVRQGPGDAHEKVETRALSCKVGN